MTGGIWTGKTDWASFEAWDLVKRLPGLWWWLAGQNFQMDDMWDKMARSAQSIGARVRTSPYRRIMFPNGSRFEAVTAKNLGLLTAKHPRGIIVDEITKIGHRAIEAIQGRAAGAERVLWMGAADYHPDLIRFRRFGRDNYDGRWALVEVATDEVGLLSPQQIEQIEKDLPRRVFLRDIKGIIPEGEGSVFTKLDRVSWWAPDKPVKALAPKKGERYRLGYDQAKTTDYSVVAVRKLSTGQIVHMSRWQKMDYHVQADLVLDISERYNLAPIYADATGANAVMEILERKRLKRKQRAGFTPTTFNNELKQQMVDNLSVALEHERLKWPGPEYGEVYQTTNDEFRVFEMRRSAKGLTWSYSAPEGMNDDTVSAIGLTCLEPDDAEGPIRGLESDEETQTDEDEEKGLDEVLEHATFIGGGS